MFRRHKLSKALADVATERDRHAGLGYTAHHDDQHGADHLMAMAGHYAMKPSPDRREHLVKCASLVIAAIEAIDRKAP